MMGRLGIGCVVVAGFMFAVLSGPVPAQEGRLLTLDQALSLALEHNPELKQAVSQTRYSTFSVEKNKDAFLPIVSGDASFSRRSTKNASQPRQEYGSLGGSIDSRVNLFKGFADRAATLTELTRARATHVEASYGSLGANINRVIQARAEYDRNRPLMEQGHLSAQEFLIMETEYKTARGVLMAARGILKRAQVNLGNSIVRSPINGKVIERSIEAGQTVAASYSTPTLFVIAEDLSKMQIEADVDESDIGLIRQDQEVRFTVQTFPDRVFGGRVSQIRLNPVVVSSVVTYTVVVAAPNDQGLLLPGMTATVDFVVDRAEDVLLAPAAALNFKPGGGKGSHASTGSALFFSDDSDDSDDSGDPRRIQVTTGVTNGTLTEVRGQGVEEGMVVLVGINLAKAEAKKGFFTRLMPRRSPRKR